MTEPAVGASTWASGSQVWTGHIGTFTAKEAKKASHSQVCNSAVEPVRHQPLRNVWSCPACQYITRMASSIRTDPSRV